MSVEIVKYNPDFKTIWNDFVESSKNGTFLFNRDYMDYHSDRYQDNSYLFFNKGKPYCLFPACRILETLSSHAGLTYAGLVMNNSCITTGIMDVFELLVNTAKKEGFKELIYKPVPYIYHDYPADEDLYALFRLNAKLISRNISSTINLSNPFKPRKDRKEGGKKAFRNDVFVKESKDFQTFWKILKDNLRDTYGAEPVHSFHEFSKLVIAFPDNIKLWAAFNKGGEMIGGVVCYYTKYVVHTQYISANAEGKKCGAIDSIILQLIREKIPEEDGDYKYFDLGTSNLDGGLYLNESLIYQKEGFGGRGVCYDGYSVSL